MQALESLWFIYHTNIFIKVIIIFNFRVRVMVFNATFNNISVISWLSVLLVEETGENDQPVASH
jgi:hypothetical protein